MLTDSCWWTWQFFGAWHTDFDLFTSLCIGLQAPNVSHLLAESTLAASHPTQPTHPTTLAKLLVSSYDLTYKIFVPDPRLGHALTENTTISWSGGHQGLKGGSKRKVMNLGTGIQWNFGVLVCLNLNERPEKGGDGYVLLLLLLLLFSKPNYLFCKRHGSCTGENTLTPMPILSRAPRGSVSEDSCIMWHLQDVQ